MAWSFLHAGRHVRHFNLHLIIILKHLAAWTSISFDTVPPMYRHSRRNMHHRVLLMIKRRRRRKNSRHRDFFTLNERAAERSTNSTFSLSSCCPDELTLLFVVAKTFRVLLGTCEKVTAGFLCELHPSLKRKSPFPVRFFTRYLTQVWIRKRKKFLKIIAKMPFVWILKSLRFESFHWRKPPTPQQFWKKMKKFTPRETKWKKEVCPNFLKSWNRKDQF